MKKLTALVFLIALFALTGCTEDEKRFTEVLQEMNTAGYYEMDSSITYEMDYTVTDESFAEQLRAMKHILNGMSIGMNGKYNMDAESGAVKAYVDFDWALDPLSANFETWVDLDLADGKYVITFAVPELVKAFIPAEYAKDYAVIDYFALLDMEDGDFNAQFEDIMAFSLDAQNDMAGFMERFGFTAALEGNVTVAAVTAGGKETLTLTMNDEQLKSFLLKYLEEIKTNTELQTEFVKLYYTMVNGEINSEEITPEMLTVLQPGFEAQIDEVIAQAEEFFGKTTLLGEDGLVYKIALDADGNVESNSMTLNFLFDAGIFAYPDFSTAPVPGQDIEVVKPDGEIALTMTLTSAFTNYNADMEVEFPELDENYINLAEIIRLEEEQRIEGQKYYFPSVYMYDYDFEALESPTDFPLTGTIGGEDVDTEITLVYYDYMLYTPLEQAAELLGGTVEYDAEKNNAFLETENGGMFIFTDYSIYDNTEELEGMSDKAQLMQAAGDMSYGVIIDGEMYVDIYTLEDLADADFGFEDATETVIVK